MMNLILLDASRRDLATEREKESCEFAKKIIGIEDWDEIIHMLKTKKN